MFGPKGGGFKGRALPVGLLLLSAGVLAYAIMQRRQSKSGESNPVED